jgi:uncharacterized protein DUF1552
MTGAVARRAVLRAAGAALALPWLESLPAFGEQPDRTRAFPKRFAVLFMGNGVNGNHWWASGGGAAMTLGRSLQPLEPLKQKINVINGLFIERAVGRGIHPAQTGGLLSGASLASGPRARAGISVDQVIADRLRREVPLPSLAIAAEPPAIGDHATGFSLTYSSHISWQSDVVPTPLEVDPARAFDALFANRGRDPRRSLLDRVRLDVRRLDRTVSASDRPRLDRYLTDVRDVETRVTRLRDNGPHDLRERLRLMCDIVALAFQNDATRIASAILARDLSRLSYPFLDVRDDHHSASHDDLSDGYERIVRFHVGQLAYLAGRLNAMPEGEGSVLDNCCLLWLSNMWAGWKHDNMKLPVVTVGGLGGTLATGRTLDYLYAGDENRRLCALHLSIAGRMGVGLDRFGDADRPLAGL